MSEKKHIPPVADFQPYLLNKLKDPEYAAGYLNEALEEYVFDGHVDSFNLAIKYVLKSQNITQMAKEVGISKQHIHRIVKGTTKPTFDLVIKLFKYLGFKFEVKAIDKLA